MEKGGDVILMNECNFEKYILYINYYSKRLITQGIFNIRNIDECCFKDEKNNSPAYFPYKAV